MVDISANVRALTATYARLLGTLSEVGYVLVAATSVCAVGCDSSPEPRILAASTADDATLRELGYRWSQGVQVTLDELKFEKLSPSLWHLHYSVTVKSDGERDVLASTYDFTEPVFEFESLDGSDLGKTGLFEPGEELPSSSLFIIRQGRPFRLSGYCAARAVTIRGKQEIAVELPGSGRLLLTPGGRYRVALELPFSIYFFQLVSEDSQKIEIAEELDDELCVLAFGRSPYVEVVVPHIE